MLAQRLLSKLCPECRKKEAAPFELQDLIAGELRKLPASVKEKLAAEFGKGGYEVYRAVPKETCKVCKGKGVSGRIAITEVFQMTRELGNIVAEGFTEDKLFKEAERQGMISMRADGIVKALKGEVLIEEVLRETE